jgi:hypothetical protein
LTSVSCSTSFHSSLNQKKGGTWKLFSLHNLFQSHQEVINQSINQSINQFFFLFPLSEVWIPQTKTTATINDKFCKHLIELMRELIFFSWWYFVSF